MQVLVTAAYTRDTLGRTAPPSCRTHSLDGAGDGAPGARHDCALPPLIIFYTGCPVQLT